MCLIKTGVYNYYCLCHVHINLPYTTITVEMYTYSSVIRGHHIELTTDVEEDNLYDQYAIAMTAQFTLV